MIKSSLFTVYNIRGEPNSRMVQQQCTAVHVIHSIFGLILSFLFFLYIFLVSHLVLGMPVNRKRKQKRQKKDINS